MSLALTPGANAPLPNAASVSVRLQAATGHADLIALLLDEHGRADGDNGVVLFSQPMSAGGAVSLDLASDTVSISVGSLPPGVERVLIVAQADGTPDVTPCATLTTHVNADGAPVATASFSDLPKVATLQLVELYRRGGAWKVRALGDGYADGLAKLLSVHGVDVTDTPAPPAASASAQASAPVQAPAQVQAPTPVQAPAPAASAAQPAPSPAASAAQAAPSPAAGGLNMRKAEGKLSLRKGEGAVLMTKTPLITARVSWDSGTDYDVYALVLMRDGTAVDVAAFPAVDTPVRMEHAGVKHLGDIKAGRGAKAAAGPLQEIIEIRLTPEVLAVVPVAYSAISNGTGSFQKYKVSLEIDNGAGTKVTVPAENGHKSSWVFTCVPGIIKNLDEGVAIEPLEYYSRRMSEKRPIVTLEKSGEVIVTMDKGATNLKKKS